LKAQREFSLNHRSQIGEVKMLRHIMLIVTACFLQAAGPLNEGTQKEVSRLRIPEKLTPKGERPLFMVRAEGVQLYKASAQLEWVFQAPRATLLDYTTGEKVGTHGEGPVWVDNDGSRLSGKAIANEPAPNAEAIPWLLLQVKNENGGRYARVKHIQRVDTWAGRAPAARPTRAGEMKEVRYQATYVFWGDLSE
jgi:hypothetical protein